MNEKFSFDDIQLLAKEKTKIKSRREVHPFRGARNKMLPIFTAPMLDIVDENNFNTYLNYGINPILPRTKDEFVLKSSFIQVKGFICRSSMTSAPIFLPIFIASYTSVFSVS